MPESSTQPPIDQGQWALIWRQFRQRKLALACAGIIVGLISVSIFAPLLANDRPLYYRGSNRFEFREAMRTAREVLSRLAREASADEQSETHRELVTALSLQQRLLVNALPVESGEELRELLDRALVAVDSGGAADELMDIRKTLQVQFGGRDIPLASRSYWPVFASLGGVEVAFMAWNIILLTFPLWIRWLRRVIPSHRMHRRHRVVAMVWVMVPLLAGLVWWWCVPSRIDRTNYKLAVLAANEDAATSPVVFETVMWPPIPYGIDENDLSRKEAKPIWAADAETEQSLALVSRWNGPHWLGTDTLGRDVLCRMIWGGRVSLSVGIVAVSIYVTIGLIVGAVAGYFRGVVDLMISRIIEVVICFPAFFLILTIVAFVGPSIFNIMVIIGLTGWTGIARLIRGEFLRLVDQEFVLAGRALGYSPTRLIFKHVMPNAIAPVLVSATFGVAGAILTESSLSFLGLGISAPTPSWGGMLTSGRDAIFRAPWLIWYPGLAIFVTISCYNLVGEALRDASDPRLRGSR